MDENEEQLKHWLVTCADSTTRHIVASTATKAKAIVTEGRVVEGGTVTTCTLMQPEKSIMMVITVDADELISKIKEIADSLEAEDINKAYHGLTELSAFLVKNSQVVET